MIKWLIHYFENGKQKEIIVFSDSAKNAVALVKGESIEILMVCECGI